MKAWIEYIRGKAQDGVLWNTRFHYGDWVALDARRVAIWCYSQRSYSDSLLYLFYRDSGKYSGILGKDEDAEEYSRLRESILKAYRDEFFTPTADWQLLPRPLYPFSDVWVVTRGI